MNVVPCSETDFRVIIGSTRIDFDPNKDDANRKEHKYSLSSAAYFLQRLALPIAQPQFITRDVSGTTGEIRHEHMTGQRGGCRVLRDYYETQRTSENYLVTSGVSQRAGSVSWLYGFFVTSPVRRF